MTRRAGIVFIIVALHSARPVFGGIDKNAAMYIGGTVGDIPEQSVGTLDFTREGGMVFRWKGKMWELPYSQIKSLEYGQKAGRRVGLAIAVTVWALFSKKRRHFLTIGFEDASGKMQAALFEIGKARVKTSLAILEARTGLKVEYQSEEARRHVYG